MKKSLFVQMGGTYHQEGDCLIPDLAPPEAPPTGIWGQWRRQHLKQNRQALYTGLLLSGGLNCYLAEIDMQAEAMFFRLVKQLAEQEQTIEQLKTENQMEWAERMNNVQNRAEEIVRSEYIYD